MQKNRYWNRFQYPAPRRFLSRNCCRKSAVMTFRSSSTAAFASSSNAPSSESPSGSIAKPGSKPRLASLRCAVAGLAAKSSSSPASSKSIGTRAKPSASRAPRSLRVREIKKRSALGEGSFGAKSALEVRFWRPARDPSRARTRDARSRKTKMFRPGLLQLRRSEKIATRAGRFGRSGTHISSFVFYSRRNARASQRVARRSTATGRGSHRYARLLPSPRRNRTSY